MTQPRINLTFRGTVTPELRRALASLAVTRACRTCDYGDDPACDHENRGKQTCQAPIGDYDCAITPCLGACATPRREHAEGCP